MPNSPITILSVDGKFGDIATTFMLAVPGFVNRLKARPVVKYFLA